MPRLDKGESMGALNCPCCGHPMQLKSDKGGKAWGFCYALNDQGNPCGVRLYTGRDWSSNRTRKLIEARQKPKPAAPPAPKPKPKPAEPAPAKPKDTGGRDGRSDDTLADYGL